MAIITFPKLENTQVALLRVDLMTGHILDEFFSLHKRSDQSQKAYTVFETLKEAQIYIEQNKSIHLDIEYHVYDIDENEIYTEIHKD